MSNIKSISIQQPCSQSWQQMESRGQGRHCSQCEKIVIDFSVMTNDEILAYLATATDVCGRISQTQLSSINYSLGVEQAKKSFNWKRWAVAAAFFGTGMISRAGAQASQSTIAATVQVPTDAGNKSLPTTDTLNKTPLTYQISGQVVASGDGLPIPGVAIRVKGTNIKVETDVNGRFKLDYQNPQVVLVVSYIGFQTQEIQQVAKKNKKLKIVLQSNSVMLGGMGVIRNAPASRLELLYQRLILPISNLFS